MVCLSSRVYRTQRYRGPEVGGLFPSWVSTGETLQDTVCSSLLSDLAIPLPSAPTSVSSEAPPALTFPSAAPPFRLCSNVGQVINIIPFPCSNLFPVWTVPPPTFPLSLPGPGAAWQASKGAWAQGLTCLLLHSFLGVLPLYSPQSVCVVGEWRNVLKTSKTQCPLSR